MVAADLNKDGRPELVFGTYALQRNAGRLIVLSARGKKLSVTRLRHQGQDGNGIGVAAAPSIGDLTGNGTLEIVLTTFDHGVDVYTSPAPAPGACPGRPVAATVPQRDGAGHGAVTAPGRGSGVRGLLSDQSLVAGGLEWTRCRRRRDSAADMGSGAAPGRVPTTRGRSGATTPAVTAPLQCRS